MWPEQQLWDSLRPRFQQMGLDPQRVENVLGPGTPDVSYTLGWVELKDVPEWPHRPTTPLKIAFERGQVPWLTRRWLKGGLCWVLIRVQKELFLVSGWESRDLAAGVTRGVLYQMAAWSNGGRWTGQIEDQLQQVLTADTEEMSDHLRAKFDRLLCKDSLQNVADHLGTTPAAVAAAEAGNNPRLLLDLIDHWEA